MRKLLDDGWTVPELAKVLRKTPDRVERYINGTAIPEPHAQRELARLIISYQKRCRAEGRPIPPQGTPEIPSEKLPPYVPNAERGVYENEVAPAGQRVFNVVSSVPGDVGIVIWPAHWVTPQFIRNLRLGLDMRDPEEKLKAI